MSYPQTRTIVNLLSGASITAAYCIHAFGRYRSGALALDNLAAWAITMLSFIGIAVVAIIVIQIVFHILMSIGIAVGKKIQDVQADDKAIEKQINAEFVEDEMDKLIALKAQRFNAGVIGAGFVAGLITLALGRPAALMLNIVFLAFLGGSLVESLVQLYYYRRGIANA
jgi:hypothetical protein